ncbi:MAG: hypothetical protein ACHP84_07560 [Caulobacterales bacterium]
MWIVVSRPLIILLGLTGLGQGAVLADIAIGNPVVANALMYSIFALIAFQAAVCVALLTAGIWGPAHRLAKDHAHRPSTRA